VIGTPSSVTWRRYAVLVGDVGCWPAIDDQHDAGSPWLDERDSSEVASFRTVAPVDACRWITRSVLTDGVELDTGPRRVCSDASGVDRDLGPDGQRGRVVAVEATVDCRLAGGPDDLDGLGCTDEVTHHREG
jgi:hypothetical protein